MASSYLRAAVGLFTEAAIRWRRDRAPMLAAALAFYMVFSLAPLLLLSVAIAGAVFDRADVQAGIVRAIREAVGAPVAGVIRDVLAAAGDAQENTLAIVISSVVLLFGASVVFNQLKAVLDTMWGVPPREAGRWTNILALVRTYLLSFMIALSIGLLVLLSVILATVVSSLREYLDGRWPPFGELLLATEVVLVLVVVPSFCGLIFRALPRTKLGLRDVWLGSVVTAILLALGTVLFSLYLRWIGVGSVYGAASSLVALLVWMYYSAQIFLFGAEFTIVYATKYGALSAPNGPAVKP